MPIYLDAFTLSIIAGIVTTIAIAHLFGKTIGEMSVHILGG